MASSKYSLLAMMARAAMLGSMPVRHLMPMRLGPSADDKPVHDRRTSRYMPHQGEREKERRLRQMKRGGA